MFKSSIRQGWVARRGAEKFTGGGEDLDLPAIRDQQQAHRRAHGFVVVNHGNDWNIVVHRRPFNRAGAHCPSLTAARH